MDRGRSSSKASAIVLVGVVAMTTAFAVSGLGPSAGALSFSPNRLVHGRLWLLFGSALVVDHPIVLSLLSFAVLAAVTMAVCGRRIYWRAAIYGHVASTLIVYAFIGCVRVVDPGSFGSALNARDYGVSAISSAWLGATVTTAWNARRGLRRRAMLVVGCCAIALFAFMIRRDTSVLSIEHLVAFALGLSVALPRNVQNRAVRRTAARHPLGIRTAAVAACTVLFVAGGIEAPQAFARLRALLLVPARPSVSRCIQRGNDAHKPGHAARGDLAAQVDVVRTAGGVACRQVSSGHDRTST